MNKEDRRRFQRGSDDLEQLEGIEKQQRRTRKPKKPKRQGQKKSKPFPLIDSVEKSRRRVKNRLRRIQKREIPSMNSAANVAKQRDFTKLLGKAIRHRDKSEYEDAIRILRALAKVKPESASVHGLLGDVYWRRGQLKQAVQSFKRATELAPKSELASLGLFHVLWESGKMERAKAEMKRYMAISNSREYALMVPQLFANGNSSLSPNSKKIKPNSTMKNSLRRPPDRIK